MWAAAMLDSEVGYVKFLQQSQLEFWLLEGITVEILD